MQMRLFMQTAFFCALVAAAAACGGDDDDDGGTTPDGGGLEVPDAAAGPSQSGEILFLETAFNGLPQMGAGPLFIIGPIQEIADQVAPSFEEAPGSPFACKAYEKTADQFNDRGLDIGTIEFSVEGGPVVPPCNFVPGQGWVCADATGSGGDIEAVDAKAGIYSITDARVTFGDDEVGRVVNIAGAAAPANNGIFPIVAADGDSAIHYLNPAAEEELATAASYATLAGVGPAGQTDPIPDDASLNVSLTAGGDGKYEDFATNLEFGDSFTLDTASRSVISDIPMDGSEFSIGCDGEGGSCGAAMATALNIDTTDAPIDPSLPPFIFPPAVEKSVRIFCIFLIPRATVPAEASAFLVNSGATRVRTIFVRAQTTDEIQPNARATLAAGHAVGGFTTVE